MSFRCRAVLGSRRGEEQPTVSVWYNFITSSACFKADISGIAGLRLCYIAATCRTRHHWSRRCTLKFRKCLSTSTRRKIPLATPSREYTAPTLDGTTRPTLLCEIGTSLVVRDVPDLESERSARSQHSRCYIYKQIGAKTQRGPNKCRFYAEIEIHEIVKPNIGGGQKKIAANSSGASN